MENTSYIALSRQMALWRKMDMVANNLANMNTGGYKGENALFSEYLVPTRDTETRLPDKLAYTQDFGSYRDLSPGPVAQTGNALDFAIEGDGYFEIDDPAGPMYTRDGRFTLNADGMIVTDLGQALMDTNGRPLVVAPTETQISVTADGTVSTENGTIGKIRLMTFDDPQAMQRVSGGLYDSGGQTARAVETPQIRQGMVEGSNVNPMLEMTTMIDVQRAYEATTRILEQENERQQRAYDVLSGAKT
ncbi:flagellar basal-body rod protein FlgF [Pararhodospirillum oryzae]|uniref:Flagellar basal-body rod protein FlgF n=1 Tax=Pararhodospirillum oryzae TaxID=478448 RepID=A0A512H8L7_9PROT|nr:flagellar basal-body rod protein FlgF [Pararhodospirillum oryzae]GEO81795.1 flagellar basal-body rod protein FlgF [Pararhodospirillum oryzae]